VTVKSSVSIVIPCYKSDSYLPKLVNSILTEIASIESHVFDIILVIDGGPSSTFDVAQELIKTSPSMRVVRLNKNYGQHAALLAGISVSSSELILTMDDDGQHPASQIKELIEHFSSEQDLLYGVPRVDEHNLIRNFASKLVKIFISKILLIPSASNLSAFRLFRRSLLINTEIDRLAVPFLDILLFWNTDRIFASKIRMEKRLEGKTNYNFKTLLKYSIAMVTSYSTRPLRAASLIGAIALICTGSFSVLLMTLHFLGHLSVPGFASVCLLIMGIGSIQLIFLGLIGEYVGIIHTKLLGKPTFNIRSLN
jgi:undecaprenyl-phosphate 4-deoxy-4-formamido-L-arabinose transferase